MRYKYQKTNQDQSDVDRAHCERFEVSDTTIFVAFESPCAVHTLGALLALQSVQAESRLNFRGAVKDFMIPLRLCTSRRKSWWSNETGIYMYQA